MSTAAFVKLTVSSAREVFVNPDHIVQVAQDSHGCGVLLTGDKTLHANESAVEIGARVLAAYALRKGT